MTPLSTRLYEHNQDLWQKFLEHPFITELAAGTLDPQKFRFYMVQDYFYLQEYLKVFAVTLAKAREQEEIQYLTSGIALLFKELATVHKEYLRELEVTDAEMAAAKPSLWNISYTHYMKACAYEGDVLAGLMALLSCSWSYAFIAERLQSERNTQKEKTFYTHWIETYAADDYQEANRNLIKRIDALSRDLSAKAQDELLTIFTLCSEYELKFWEMSYHQTLK